MSTMRRVRARRGGYGGAVPPGGRGELDYERGRWLLAAYRLSLHESLGLGSFAEYAERGAVIRRVEKLRRAPLASLRVRVADA